METLYRKHISTVAISDAEKVIEKDEQYGASWKRRGGIGAFMMLARKMDRLEEQVKRFKYDIFLAIESDAEATSAEDFEGIIDTLRDLRRYGLLVEAEMIALGVVDEPKLKEHWWHGHKGMSEQAVAENSKRGEHVGSNFKHDESVPEVAPSSNEAHSNFLRRKCIEAVEGDRYSSFHEYAKTLGYTGLKMSEIRDRLKNVNSSRQSLGRTALPDEEIIQIVESIPLVAQKV